MACGKCEVVGVTCSDTMNLLCLLCLLLCISNCERGESASHKRKFDPDQYLPANTAPIASMSVAR
jgi:hypothetical protein